jgi:hypothetical protein
MFLFFVLILNVGIDTICVTKPFIAFLFICYKEFTCLIPGLLYFVAIPSMSMLLFLYSIGNLHNVSWGTRETKTDNPEPDKAKQQQKHTPAKEETRHFSPLWYVEVSLLIKNKSDVTITSCPRTCKYYIINLID